MRAQSIPCKHRVRGTVALELLLVMPVILVLAMAFIEYALILTCESKLNLAAYAGANVARHGGSEEDVDQAVVAALPAHAHVSNRTVKIIRLNPPSAQTSQTTASPLWQRTSTPSQNSTGTVTDSRGTAGSLVSQVPLSAIQVRVEVPANRVVPNMLKYVGFDLAGEKLTGVAVLAKE